MTRPYQLSFRRIFGPGERLRNKIRSLSARLACIEPSNMTSLTYYRWALANGLHEDGLPLLLWRILVKLVSPLARIGIDLLYERDLTGEIPLVKARVEATLRHATEADVDAIIALRGPIRGHPVRPSQEGPQDAFGSAEEGEAELREKY